MPRPFDTITIEQVARFPRPGMVVPGALRFTPDSKALTYLFSAEGSLVRSLWRYDLATEQTWADYRTIDGVAVPHRVTHVIKNAEGLVYERVYSDFKFVDKLDPKLFDKPEAGRR